MNTPIWTPSKQRLQQSNMFAFIQYVKDHYKNVNDYQELYQWSINDPELFWAALWKFTGIIATTHWQSIKEDHDNMWDTQWFTGTTFNFAENLLRYCEQNDDKPAIIFWGEDKVKLSISYRQLYLKTLYVSNTLRRLGVQPGDVVAGYLPNIPETVIAMLSTISIGAIWSSCSPDFGVNGLVDRFGQIHPKVLFCADGYYYKGKTIPCLPRLPLIQQQIPSIEHILVCQYTNIATDLSQINNASWLDDAIEKTQQSSAGQHKINFQQRPFNHPVYIMYSSGTTGKPKCIVHGAGGTLIQHLKELVLHTDIKPIDRVFYYTTCGWMMWNWLVSSLATGTTIMLYDGNPFYPTPEILFDYAEQEKISVFGTSAKYLAAVQKYHLSPKTTHQLASLKTILSTGSPLSAELYDYSYQHIKNDMQLSSIAGGTDIISCFALGNPLLPVYRGELQSIGLGMKVEIFDEQGHPVKQQKGELVCSSAFPSMPLGFWHDINKIKYQSAYFNRYPNVWAHGDYAELSTHHGLIIYGRSDAVLNPGGVRIGTAEIYRQAEKLPEVFECIAVGQQWKNDVRVILFVKLANDIHLTETLQEKIKKTIKENTTSRHVPHYIIEVKDIPKTISGKIVELSVADVIHNRPVKNIDALANPESLDYFKNLPILQAENEQTVNVS